MNNVNLDNQESNLLEQVHVIQLEVLDMMSLLLEHVFQTRNHIVCSIWNHGNTHSFIVTCFKYAHLPEVTSHVISKLERAVLVIVASYTSTHQLYVLCNIIPPTCKLFCLSEFKYLDHLLEVYLFLEKHMKLWNISSWKTSLI